MRDAVIVSTARTPIGKAFRGAFNQTHGAVLAGHAIAHAPVTTAGTTINRFCSSGLQAISIAAQRVLTDHVPIMVAGGVESISLVQNALNQNHLTEASLLEHKPELWMSMIDTAEVVAKRYGVSREAQDTYARISQQRTAEAQRAGRLDDEIVPLSTTKLTADKNTGETQSDTVTLTRDEGNRPNTTAEGLAALTPVTGEDGYITAGRQSAGNPVAEITEAIQYLRAF